MRRLLYVAAGFIGGVVVSRNAAAMPHPVASAVLLGVVAVVALAWWAGHRDKASAVAVAVAKAEAIAAAKADAQAAAIAQAAVHLHMTAGGVTEHSGAPSSEAPARAVGRHAAGELLDGRAVRALPARAVEDDELPWGAISAAAAGAAASG
ncbi:MAG: hypothetical protein BGO38_05330 [Cellulomonas sp. 73-145]|uniref:hypothetical protein n=1 Tax=Cellulomonas sp. 73-145 TaxID=1895739 RepID=UPI0009258979|nr:hypothetical protein [Cellulomonas sp. 73-145]MBN9326852.1 hypothetical protein [Cellulomonas sp.]OJV57557.1 MAG: hypothetical protein BGO38_05330 [Cellulomonas sp. 73-145]